MELTEQRGREGELDMTSGAGFKQGTNRKKPTKPLNYNKTTTKTISAKCEGRVSVCPSSVHVGKLQLGAASALQKQSWLPYFVELEGLWSVCVCVRIHTMTSFCVCVATVIISCVSVIGQECLCVCTRETERQRERAGRGRKVIVL